MAQVGSVIDNKYEVLKEIGKGGMSTVYLAMDKRLNKQWAIKELRRNINDKNDEITIKSFLVEANLMKKLDHPTLPRIVDIIDNGRNIYVVMDYIEGESLDKILQMQGAQPQDTVIEWAKQLCGVLSYLHSQDIPIIYRDMKPANIMLKPDGTLKLIDFGIAREYKKENVADTVSLGTRGYAAPEQFGGMGQTDARTDIYCLGVTLYHLVTGQNPADPPYELYPIRQWNPALSSGLEYIIQKCTQLNPEDRYQNCNELMYALEHYDETDETYKKKQRKRLFVFGTFATLTVLFLASGLIFGKMAVNENNKDYDDKINISLSTDYEEKINIYKEAIELYPYRTEAYIKLLQAYTDNGSFNDKQSTEFMNYYNKAFSESNSKYYDEKSKGFAELNYQAGITYLYLYNLYDNNTTFKVRTQKAYNFFEKNIENTTISNNEKYNITNSYYIVCKFFKDYVSNVANRKEPTKKAYYELVISLNECVNNLDTYNAEDMEYVRLTIYETMINLIMEQRNSLAKKDNEDKDVVLNLMERLYKNTEELVVSLDVLVEKKNRILANKQEYLDMINAAYAEFREREE